MSETTTSKIKTLTTSTFDSEIGNGDTYLVDFWAPWCGPCMQQLPILEQFADSEPKGVTVAKVNITDEPGIAEKLGIRSIPTMIVFRDGEEVLRHTGLAAPAQLAKLVE